jgi:hypothetical protein
MPSRNTDKRQYFDRPLYPVLILGDDSEVRPAEIVRFGGFPFCRTVAGEWHLLDRVDIGGVVETDD